MGKSYANFMCKKFFHPSSYDNIKRVWMAQQRTDAEKTKQDTLKAEYERDQETYENRQLMGDKKVRHGLTFMYEPPKGFKTDETEKNKDGEPQYKFEWQRSAPRESYAKDMEITDQPFGIAVRNVKCIRCHQWGHVNTDRECPMFNENKDDSIAGPSTDKNELLADMRRDGYVLKQNALDRKVDGRATNEQIIASDEEDVPEEAFLKSLSTKQKKKLLKKLNELEKPGGLRKSSKKKNKSKKKKKRKHQSSSRSDSDSSDEQHKRKKDKKRKMKRKQQSSSSSDDDSDSESSDSDIRKEKAVIKKRKIKEEKRSSKKLKKYSESDSSDSEAEHRDRSYERRGRHRDGDGIQRERNDDDRHKRRGRDHSPVGGARRKEIDIRRGERHDRNERRNGHRDERRGEGKKYRDDASTDTSSLEEEEQSIRSRRRDREGRDRYDKKEKKMERDDYDSERQTDRRRERSSRERDSRRKHRH